jgi:hypothetical protein
MMQAQGVTQFLVIDGQQRLTSLLIALSALRYRVAVDQPSVVERFNDRYLLNKYGKGLSRFRLLPTQSDRHAFFSCIEGADPTTQANGIGRAYSYFRARLTRPGPDNEPLDLDRIETVISQRLQFVAVTADANDNVHRIFESLNDRGVQLTQADLLRNFVFILLPTRAEAVYESVWLPMQQLLSPAQMETLVFVDLILRGDTTAKRQDIYRGQQARLRPLVGNEAAIEAEVWELARRARLFQRIVDPQTESDPGTRAALSRLGRWGSATASAWGPNVPSGNSRQESRLRMPAVAAPGPKIGQRGSSARSWARTIVSVLIASRQGPSPASYMARIDLEGDRVGAHRSGGQSPVKREIPVACNPRR